MEVVLTNKPEDRRLVVTALEQFAREQHLPAAAVQAADLALEEHLTNVVRYGYGEPAASRIVVRLSVEPGFLCIQVEDDGKPFNPLERPEVDTSVPLEAKPIGGLGIHLIRKFMDDVQYRREANRNILSLRKRV